MKKIHGTHSIQKLTITDEVVADDAKIKEHKIDFSFKPSDIAPLIEDVANKLKVISDWVKKDPSFKVCPEYPNGVLTSLGESAILGMMHTDYDAMVDKTYFEWSSGEEDMQYYGIMFKHTFKLPPDIAIGYEAPGMVPCIHFTSGKFYTYLDGDVSIRVRVYDDSGNILIEKTASASEIPNWVTIMFDAADIEALNTYPRDESYLRFEIRMGSRANGKVRIADFEIDAEYSTRYTGVI